MLGAVQEHFPGVWDAEPGAHYGNTGGEGAAGLARLSSVLRVTVLCDPNDYDNLIARIDEGAELTEYRRTLGRKAFAHTARYDAAISAWFNVAIGTVKSMTASALAKSGSILSVIIIPVFFAAWDFSGVLQ